MKNTSSRTRQDMLANHDHGLLVSLNCARLNIAHLSPREKRKKFLEWQECIPVGCIPSAAVAMSIPACTGHCVSQHVLGRGGCLYPSMHWAGGCVYPSMHWAGGCLPRGVSAQGGVCPRGVSAQGGVCLGRLYPSMHWGRHPPPWTEWQV